MKYYSILFSIIAAIVAFPSAIRGGEGFITGHEAVLVLGKTDLDDTISVAVNSSNFRLPGGLAIDPVTGKVFVADTINNRVLRFTSVDSLSNGIAAEAVLGQTDFTSDSASTTASGMDGPFGVCVKDNYLWVADTGNNRVLRFDDAAGFSTGAAADVVLGQADFTSSSSGSGTTGLSAPYDVVIAPGGILCITDRLNNRIVVHEEATSKTDGAACDYVLGQTDTSRTGPSTGQNRLRYPRGMAVSPDGALYVADTSNHRIMVFENFSELDLGSNASRQIGQVDFSENELGLSVSTFSFPTNVAVSSEGVLVVTCENDNRSLVFTDASDRSGVTNADAVIGQDNFESDDTGTGASGLDTPRGAAFDSEDRLYLVDSANRRVLRYDMLLSQPDLTVGKSRSERKGDDIYNSNASRQKKSIRSSSRKIKAYYTAENDGTIAETYTLRGKGSNRKFRVKCYLLSGGKTNITSAVKRGTYETDALETGDTLIFRSEIRPKSSTRGNRANFNAWLRVASSADGEVDKVIGKIKYRP